MFVFVDNAKRNRYLGIGTYYTETDIDYVKNGNGKCFPLTGALDLINSSSVFFIVF